MYTLIIMGIVLVANTRQELMQLIQEVTINHSTH